ncbi:MAG: M3 family oligoendopeptidase [Planctomycetota bacterium]
MVQAAPLELPHWDLTNIYSGLESSDYESDIQRLEQMLNEVRSYYDQNGIRHLDAAPAATADLAATLATVIELENKLKLLANNLDNYVYCHYATDSRDPIASREYSRNDKLQADRTKLVQRRRAWIGSLEPVLEQLFTQREELEPYRFFCQQCVRSSRYMMTEELEELAAELALDGAQAFSKLQSTLASQLRVSLQHNGTAQELPISVVRNLCTDADPAVRESAYRAELVGWESIAPAVAASLNAIKGSSLTLARRRGRDSVVAAAAEANRIDMKTLDALMESIRESYPVFRRYLKSKAKRIGKETMAWWDLFAPVGASDMHFTWDQAREFLADKFGEFSDELRDFACHAIDRGWIDAEPREGKNGGGFCINIPGTEESRVLVNFDGGLDQLFTLAHELGHAYHNHCQVGLDIVRKGSPSTLAETASIFCETLVCEATLANASAETQLSILESQVSGATQVCLDISSRYLFENALFEKRAESTLSADELCAVMQWSQSQTYADAIDPKTYHPYMWVWKPHYYSASSNFYNFPYAFGHLFGLGLYALYREEGESFIPRYKELLRSTETDYAAPLAARFGIDITTPDFWRKSLQMIEEQVSRYEALE